VKATFLHFKTAAMSAINHLKHFAITVFTALFGAPKNKELSEFTIF
jgi:hypothetical protein